VTREVPPDARPSAAQGARERLTERLEDIEEPGALRQKLRNLARNDPEFAQSEAIRLFSAWLWRRWRPELTPFGYTPRELRALLGGDRRELWLWLMGDRPFAQLAQGVAGRVTRRLGG
jgi:hypothetical protein